MSCTALKTQSVAVLLPHPVGEEMTSRSESLSASNLNDRSGIRRLRKDGPLAYFNLTTSIR